MVVKIPTARKPINSRPTMVNEAGESEEEE